MTVSRRLRFEILRRDKNACRYCGAMAPDVPLHVDHVVPVALGGSDEPENLVTACQDCNAGKSSMAPDQSTVADVSSDATRWAAALEQAKQEAEADRDGALRRVEEFDRAWRRYRIANTDRDVPRPAKWVESVQTFLNNGLSMEVIVEYVDVAMESKATPEDTFRYFCGCCWKAVSRLEERATEILQDEIADDDGFDDWDDRWYDQDTLEADPLERPTAIGSLTGSAVSIWDDHESFKVDGVAS